jgi:hypothetical protein
MTFRTQLVAVMAGLVPAIHVSSKVVTKDVDARDKRGHDETESFVS